MRQVVLALLRLSSADYGQHVETSPRTADVHTSLLGDCWLLNSCERTSLASASTPSRALASLLLSFNLAVAFNLPGRGTLIYDARLHRNVNVIQQPFCRCHPCALISMNDQQPDMLESFQRVLQDVTSGLFPTLEAYAAKTPVVILPGFGNDANDYVTPLGQPEEAGLVAALERRGFIDVSVLPVQRLDWARVLGGLVDGDWYRGKQSPYGSAYGWYVQRAREEIKAAAARSNSKVMLVAHSAGGWLARAVLGDGETSWDDSSDGGTASDYVRTLITLGAPHFPPPDSSKCATRGALEFVSEQYPGAFLSSQGVQYITVAGDAITGKNVAANRATEDNAELDELYKVRGEGSAQRVAFVNYETVSGDGTERGDGVIPLSFAHLDGARQVTLADVRHSFNEAGTTQLAASWYGSDDAVDQWVKAIDTRL